MLVVEQGPLLVVERGAGVAVRSLAKGGGGGKPRR